MHFFPYRSEETWRKFHSRNATRDCSVFFNKRDCSVLKEPKGNDIPFNSGFQRWPLPPLGSGCSFFFMNLRSTSCWRKPCPQVRLQHARRWSILQTKTSGISKKPPGYASADSRCCVSKTAARKRWIDGVGCTYRYSLFPSTKNGARFERNCHEEKHTRLRSYQLTASGRCMETTRSGNTAPYFRPMNLAISDVSAFMPKKKELCTTYLFYSCFFFHLIFRKHLHIT